MAGELMRAQNPFGSAPASLSATVETDNAKAVAEVQAAMIVAKRFPRNQIQAMDRVLQACTRPSLAERALYSYARGGTDITGPSIRLAEAIAQVWGNLQYGVRELEQRDGESVVEAFAWDVESNTRRVVTFTVRHERHTRQGKKSLDDPRDIYEMVANQGARRLRACLLGVIPGDVVEEAVKQVEATMANTEKVTPERVKKLVEAFASYKVSASQIEKRIQRRLDAITPQLMVQLRKIYTSLHDGMSRPEDWFEAEAGSQILPKGVVPPPPVPSEPRSPKAVDNVKDYPEMPVQPVAQEPAQEPCPPDQVDESTLKELAAAAPEISGAEYLERITTACKARTITKAKLLVAAKHCGVGLESVDSLCNCSGDQLIALGKALGL